MSAVSEYEQVGMTPLEWLLLDGRYVFSKSFPLRIGMLKAGERYGEMKLISRTISSNRHAPLVEAEQLIDRDSLAEWFLLQEIGHVQAGLWWTYSTGPIDDERSVWKKCLDALRGRSHEEAHYRDNLQPMTCQLLDTCCKQLTTSLRTTRQQIAQMA